MAFRRNIFTGELEEYQSPENGREVIARIEPAYVPKRRCKAYDSAHPWVTNTLSIDISQMKQFNEDARRHGTGAYYQPDPRNPQRAQLVCPTRRSRKRELARRGGVGEPIIDFDGGYSD